MIRYIRLKNLRVHALVGCIPGEREERRTLEVDVELKVKLGFTQEGDDDLSRSVDYRKIRSMANDLAYEREFSLVETYADMLAMRLADMEHVTKARVIVRKPGALPGREIPEIEAVWKREDD